MQWAAIGSQSTQGVIAANASVERPVIVTVQEKSLL
jgi:hypothetical protein